MSTNNLYKKTIPEYSRISRINRFLRSSTGFRIGIIIIGFIVIALIEFGLIVALFLGEFLNNDYLMSYTKQKMIFFKHK